MISRIKSRPIMTLAIMPFSRHRHGREQVVLLIGSMRSPGRFAQSTNTHGLLKSLTSQLKQRAEHVEMSLTFNGARISLLLWFSLGW